MEQIIAHRRPLTGKGGHHGIGEIAVAAPGNADHHAGQRQQCRTADAEGDQDEGQGHPHGGEQYRLPAADVGGQIPREEYRRQVAPGGQGQQKAPAGIAEVINFLKKGHEIAHEHGSRAADKEHKEGIGDQLVFLFSGCFGHNDIPLNERFLGYPSTKPLFGGQIR